MSAAKAAKASAAASEEQLLYANLLEKGMYLGLLIMFVTFGIYCLNLVQPAIPRADLASYWQMPVHDYIEAMNEHYLHLEHPPTGWAWVNLVGYSDFMNFIGIALLAGITVLCYLAIVPTLWRKRDTTYAVLCLAEAAILILAASGILAVGH